MNAGFYLILGLVGSGYLFSKDGKTERQTDENIPSSIEPSGNNIYDSNNYDYRLPLDPQKRMNLMVH